MQARTRTKSLTFDMVDVSESMAANEKKLVWARDGDGENAVEHPAYLLGTKTETPDGAVGDVTSWIEWASNGSIVCIPNRHIRFGGLGPRQSRKSQSMVKKEEIKIKDDPTYSYETDEEDGNFPKVAVTPPTSAIYASIEGRTQL